MFLLRFEQAQVPIGIRVGGVNSNYRAPRGFSLGSLSALFQLERCGALLGGR